MNKIWIIVQREYISRVKKRSFIITTLLAPLGFFLLITSSVLISTYSQGKMRIAVINQSPAFKDVLDKKGIPDPEDGSVHFEIVDSPYDQLAGSIKKEREDSAQYQAIILIPPDFKLDSPVIQCHYIKRPGESRRHIINQKFSTLLNEALLSHYSINKDVLDEIQNGVTLKFNSLTNEKENDAYNIAAAVVGFVMGLAIYISLFFYGTMIMKGVMEEKTNRIVEILTSSVKPFQLLMGKIIGIGAVGLTQFVLWILLMFGVNIFAGLIFGVAINNHSAVGMQQNGMDPDDIQVVIHSIGALPFGQIAMLFPIYFLGGFLLYGSLYAAVGAAIGEDGDQQSLAFPITIPIIISFFIAMNVINNPDSSLGLWGSLIPFTSPVVMSARLPFAPDWWQIALSVILLIGGFVFTTYIAARIYRVGILMYGKKVKTKEIIRWIFSKG